MIEVKVPSFPKKVVKGLKSVPAEGETIEEVLDNIESRYPGFKEKIIDEKGEMRQFVNLYLNDEDIRTLQGLKTKLKDGDIITILPAVAGGK